jgi:hypothetical protein
MLFQVIVGQNLQLIFKGHLQGPVPPSQQNRAVVQGGFEGEIQLSERMAIQSSAVSSAQKRHFRKSF